MILAIDMGNTHTEIGLLEGDKILMSERIKTDPGKTETEYAVLLHTIFVIHHIEMEKIEGCVMSSVVPPLTNILCESIKEVTGCETLVVGPGVRNGLKLRMDEPRHVGTDLVVDAVAAVDRYGAPCIVIDMGTATTLTYIDEEKVYRGGMIVPGVAISLEALESRTAQLPHISFGKPGRVVGTNTIDCMKSGIIYGQAAMLDGLIDRIREEMHTGAKAVATGGLAGVIVPYCRHDVAIDRELILHGLRLIYEKNR